MRFGPAILLVSLLAPSWALAQVYKCQDAYGRMVYSDVSCASNQTGKLIQRERSFEQKLSERQEAYAAQNAKQERRRIEEVRAQLERDQYAVEHQRQSQAAQQAAMDQRDEAQRGALMRSATTVMPGARGITRGQREVALQLSRTPQEREALMREATTVMPGAEGLTASQLDAAARLHQSQPGRPIPPPSHGVNQHEYQSPQPQLPQPAQPPSPAVMTHCAGGFCYDNQGGVYHQHGNGTTMTGPSGGTCIRAGTMVQC